MTSAAKPIDMQEKIREKKLATVIRDRLELREKWFPRSELPDSFKKIERSQLNELEIAFKELVKKGCKWEVLLTCLARYHTYNTKERIKEKAQYGPDDELSRRPVKERVPIDRPPDRDKRESI